MIHFFSKGNEFKRETLNRKADAQNGLANMHKMNSTKGKDQTIEPCLMGTFIDGFFLLSEREMDVPMHVLFNY